MSPWSATFRAEFRRVAPLLPWVAGLHLLMFFIRTGLGLEISRRLAVWTEVATWLLAAVILIPSLWNDSPFRRETFIATRPVKPVTFFSAKLAGLIALVVLPFVAVEFASLLATGFSLRVICLGTLQTFLFGLITLIALFPAVWLWRARWSAALGWAIMLASVHFLIGEVARQLHKHGSYVWAYLDRLLYPPLLLLALALITLCLAGLLACPARLRRWLKPLLCIPAVCLPVYLSLWAGSRRDEVPRGEEVPFAWLYLISNQGIVDQFNLNVPKPASPPALGVERGLARLVVNGRDYSAPQTLPPGTQSGHNLEDHAIQDSLRKHFGDKLKLPRPETSDYGVISAAYPFKRDDRGKLAFDLTECETTFRWEVIGELPLVEGSALKEGDSTWTVEKLGSIAGREHLPDRWFTLTRRYPLLWLGSLQNAAARDSAYRFFIVAPNGDVFNGGAGWGETGVCSTLRVRHFTMSVTQLPDEDAYQDSGYEAPEVVGVPSERSAGARLVILRAVAVSRNYYSWRSPEPLDAPQPSFPGRNNDPAPDPHATTAIEWLKTHPAPAGDAPAETISAWLAELLPRARGYDFRKPEFGEVVTEIGKLVPSRPDLIESARPAEGADHQADNLLQQALSRHITRDAVARFPALRESASILRLYWTKGWFKDIATDVARKIRSGDARTNLMSLLLTDPEALGFSESEWLAFFRLYPTGDTFRVLRGKYLPEALIDREADAAIDRFIAALPRWSRDNYPQSLGLALARGRVEAPRWFHEWLRAAGDSRSFNEAITAQVLQNYFEVPAEAGSRKAIIEWFLAQDAAAFRLDSATGKYRLP